MTDAGLVAYYRRFLLAVAAFLFAGTVVELVLTEHWAEWQQWMAFVFALVGFVAVAVAALRPSRVTMVGLRGAMGLVAAGSLVGVFFHLRGNWLFERDIRPAATVGAISWEALFGASPLLAPGILLLGAVLAWAATFSHPALPPTRR